MHENVLRAIVGLDEPVALLGVEPLYGSSSHCKPFKDNYAAPAIERRSNFGTERKANSARYERGNGTPNLGVRETYMGWLRSRYKKRREGSYDHQRGGEAMGMLVMPLAKTALGRERMPRESRQEQKG